MLLSVVVVDDCKVGSLKSTSRLPVVSVRAYRACDSSACLPRGIMDGILSDWSALVQYVWTLWPVGCVFCSSRPYVCRLIVVLVQSILGPLLASALAGGYSLEVKSDLADLLRCMCIFARDRSSWDSKTSDVRSLLPLRSDFEFET
jgi:hypothetical protein